MRNQPKAPRSASNDFQPKLSDKILILIGKSGHPYRFDLYRQAFVKGLFSPCKRVRVHPCRDEDGDTVPNQFDIFFNGNKVPDDRYTFKYAKKSGFRSHGRV